MTEAFIQGTWVKKSDEKVDLRRRQRQQVVAKGQEQISSQEKMLA
jgi:hypothetical protein